MRPIWVLEAAARLNHCAYDACHGAGTGSGCVRKECNVAVITSTSTLRPSSDQLRQDRHELISSSGNEVR